MRTITSLFIGMGLFLLSPTLGLAAPLTFTYQGQLFDEAFSGPLVGPVDLTIGIYADACLLHTETHPGVTLSNGYFSIEVGSGAKTGGVSEFNLVFTNSALDDCVPPVAAGATRKIRLTVTQGTESVVLEPDQVISAVPYAMMAGTATTFQGKSPNEFAQISTNVTQANLETLTGGTGSNASSLHSHSQYLQTSGGTLTGGITLPSGSMLGLGSYSTDPALGSLTAADIGKTWYNTSTKEIHYYDGNVIQSLGIKASLNTDAVAEGSTNEYFTDARARGAISAPWPLTYATVAGTVGLSIKESGSEGSPTANNKILGVNAGGTATEYKAISGTNNQISVGHTAGQITLSTPQNLHSGASPSFAGMSLSGAFSVSPTNDVVASIIKGSASQSTDLQQWQDNSATSLARMSYDGKLTTKGLTIDGLGDVALVADANGKISASSVSATELGYLDGVTSSIQTQLNGKLSALPQALATDSSPTFVGLALTGSASVAGTLAVGGDTSVKNLTVNSFTTPGFVKNSGTGLLSSGTLSSSDLPTLGGDLSGTSYSNITVSKINGTSVPAYPGADRVLMASATANSANWTTIPDCDDSAGSHLNYDTATHSFACGTSSKWTVVTGNPGSIYYEGAVGIGTTNPSATLDVAGQIRAQTKENTGTTIDWNNGNVQTTTVSCGPGTKEIGFSNMLEGGSYTLIVTGAASGICTFTQSLPEPLLPAAFKFLPSNAATTANKTTIYTFLRAGDKVYTSWVSGFEP